MPIYDFKCSDCGNIEERIRKISDMNSQTCSCGGAMEVQISSSRMSYHAFPEGFFDNIVPPESPDYKEEGVYIRNKKELRDVCRKHNTGIVYLEDL